MRIGMAVPRLNGLGVFGAPDLSGIVNSYGNSFLNNLGFDLEQGTAVSPDVVASTLTNAVRDACAAVAPTPCDPSSAASLIADMVVRYTTAYNSGKANLAANVAAGLIATPLPASAYIPPVAPPVSTSQVQYSSQPANALDRVTPQTSQIIQTPAGNVLSPPVTPAPVSGQNAGTFTATPATISGPGVLAGTMAIGGMNVPVWALLGVAAIGIFMMVGGKKGR